MDSASYVASTYSLPVITPARDTYRNPRPVARGYDPLSHSRPRLVCPHTTRSSSKPLLEGSVQYYHHRQVSTHITSVAKRPRLHHAEDVYESHVSMRNVLKLAASWGKRSWFTSPEWGPQSDSHVVDPILTLAYLSVGASLRKCNQQKVKPYTRPV